MELRFLFAVHNHQPVGNFESVVDRAFRDCYRPFLKAVGKHPGFKFSLHFSGFLWEHMESKEPACWDMLQAMAGRGQVELLGGGFYEPILPVIPEEDRAGQIALMSGFLEKSFGRKPRGLWLAERVWEPQLAKTLALAGIEYTMLDEEHFHYAGIRNLYASYITEEEGLPLRLFPIDKRLRYMIPFHPLDQLEAYLHEIQALGGTAILGDDGEKFGLWPGTKKWVYEEGWLDGFLRFVEEKNIRMITCSEYLDECPPAGRVYLPPASYEEMMGWVLEPAELEAFENLRGRTAPSDRRFIRGGLFREFFLKYPEANHLHKRMIIVSRELRGGDPAAVRDLYRGQCNDPYWHGVFGGLYLPHLRESAYHHLIEAEKRTSSARGWARIDYDVDGREEWFLRGEPLQLLVKPSFGGSLIEIDYMPWARNLCDVLARRPEAYHFAREEAAGEGRSIHELAKKLPPRAKDLMRYDWHPRYSLLDHFIHQDSTEEDFRRIDYGEQGDFVNQPYESALRDGLLVLERKGGVWCEGERVPVLVRKRLEPGPDGLKVAYEIENLGARLLSIRFGSEWNLLAFPQEIEFHRRGWVKLYGGQLFFAPGDPAELWTMPLETLSQSEEGFDIIHQGYSLMPLWNLALDGGQTGRLEISLKEMHVRP
jgi:alpha-amylase/alpha-mannosidase (GH57 family)